MIFPHALLISSRLLLSSGLVFCFFPHVTECSFLGCFWSEVTRKIGLILYQHCFLVDKVRLVVPFFFTSPESVLSSFITCRVLSFVRPFRSRARCVSVFPHVRNNLQVIRCFSTGLNPFFFCSSCFPSPICLLENPRSKNLLRYTLSDFFFASLLILFSFFQMCVVVLVSLCQGVRFFALCWVVGPAGSLGRDFSFIWPSFFFLAAVSRQAVLHPVASPIVRCLVSEE